LLNQLSKCKDKHTKSCLQKELKLANKIHNIIIAEAKESYVSKLAEKNARLAGTNSKAAWKAVRECELGNKNQPQKNKNHGSQTTQWPKGKNRQRKHERLPPPLHQSI
jgi:hypothetical protein